MHSIIISIAIAAFLALELLTSVSSLFSFSSVVFMVAIATAVIGIPHGGLDHKLGRDYFALRGWPAMTLFLAFYLLVAGMVVAGWYLVPAATVFGFIGLSAWHFGLEEDERHGSRNWLQWAGLFARGGMVVWVPATFRGSEMAALLNMVLPIGDSALAGSIVALLATSAPLLMILLVVDVTGPTRVGASTIVRLVSLFVLFAVFPPLWSFGIYFCGWHSIRGFVHLQQQTGYSARQLLPRLIPISLSAIVLLVAGLFWWSSVYAFTPAVVRTLFIGLSALAVPHLLLHVAIDLKAAVNSPDGIGVAVGFSGGATR